MSIATKCQRCGSIGWCMCLLNIETAYSNDIIFNITEKEQEEINKFKEAVKTLHGKELEIEYIFKVGNGIGRTLKIRCEEINVEKDITDYENW